MSGAAVSLWMNDRNGLETLMKRIWLATTLMLCGLAQALFVGQVARAEDEASGAKLLPKDTLLFVSVPSIPDSNEEFEKSLTGAMFRDPELKPFLDDVQKKIDELSEKLQQEIGVSINDLLEIPQGELTFAVVERPARKLAPILIVDYGDKKETVDKLLKKLHEGLEGDIAEHSVEEVDDIKVHVYTFKDSDPDNPFKTLAYFSEDSTLVFSTEVAALKEVLDRWDGEGSDTLADNDIYKYIQDRCKEESGEPDLVWYLSPIGLIQSGLNMAQSVVPQAGVAAIFLPTLGIDRLKGWGGASFTGVGDYDSISKAFVFSEQPKGVLEVFLFPATDLAPPKWVSADTSVYFGGNWNIPQAYTAIETMIDGFQGRGFTAKQLDRAADGGPGIHPKKDVIDLLDGKFHMVQGFEENEDGVPTQQFLIAFDVKDAAKMKKTLAKAAKAGEGQVETREFNGETIYEVSAGGDQVISLAVAAGHFVVTNDTPTLEGMLRTDSQGSLADSPAYKKVAKHFPAKVSMISYSRSDSQLKALYEMLKGLDNSEFIEGIDLQKLPPFETLQKYLRPSGSFTVPDKKGALTVGFQLREGDK
jgi:hypothetical protein